MKILSFINPIRFGGGERLMIDFGRYFKGRGIKFTTINLNRSSEFEEELKKEGLPFLNIGDIHFGQTPRKAEYVFLLARLLGSIPTLAKLIGEESPDYVMANGFPSIILVALACIFIKPHPKMIYMHHFMKAKEGALSHLVYAFFLRRYEKIIGVSSHVRDTLVENFPELERRITFVPNGIECARFRINEDKVSLRKKLGLPGGVIGINVARLAAFKNQRVLVDLARKIKRKDAHILILGEGDEYGSLSGEIERTGVEGAVRLMGRVDSALMPQYLRAADIFLFPSLKEGFSIAVLEAMAAGLPVVILKNIYAEELGSDLFVAKDADEFEAMALRLFDDGELRISTGNKARSYIENHLDITATGQRLLEVIR